MVALALPAGAVTRKTDLGTLSDGDFGIVDHLFVLPQTFHDTINFTLTSTSTISGLVAPFRLLSATWSLSSALGAIDGGALTFGRYSFADLAPGSYTVSIFGQSKALGGYAASYKVAVAAVPELETWLMLIIGVGLAAFQLHRRQKSLSDQSLDDGLASPA
jgi:hypothetical protein